MPTPLTPSELQYLYEKRLTPNMAYRRQVWDELCAYFSRWVPRDATVLDLGCGYCEFINGIKCARKFAMDLNPAAAKHAGKDVTLLAQDCSEPWNVPSGSLDVVFTSNFFEHLPDKTALENTLEQAFRSLKSGGRLVAMGPNIKYVPGAYWDFFDHYLQLTELSLAEALHLKGFAIETCIDRFMPYTMSQGRTYPIIAVKIYLALPVIWRFFGRQLLVVAVKP